MSVPFKYIHLTRHAISPAHIHCTHTTRTNDPVISTLTRTSYPISNSCEFIIIPPTTPYPTHISPTYPPNSTNAPDMACRQLYSFFPINRILAPVLKSHPRPILAPCSSPTWLVNNSFCPRNRIHALCLPIAPVQPCLSVTPSAP